jgi:hypothetical protein
VTAWRAGAEVTQAAIQGDECQIDADEIPSRERRGRLAVEVARSYHLRRKYPATPHWLEQAHQARTDSPLLPTPAPLLLPSSVTTPAHASEAAMTGPKDNVNARRLSASREELGAQDD